MAPPEGEEQRSMLGYHAANYDAKIIQIGNVCEDIENNNTRDKDSTLDEKCDIIYYSSNSKGIFAQCLVSGAVLLLLTGGGMPIGYSAILLPQLAEENGTMYADRQLGSWIASVHSLATPVGSLVSGPLLDEIGRRGSLQFAAVPLFVGWFVIGFAKNISCLLIGRVVLGFGVGLMGVPAQVLLGETADSTLRGFLTGSTLTFYCLGIVIIYALGACFTWNIVALCGAVLPITALIALILIPESPAWLVRRRKPDKARKALLWLRGGNVQQVDAEMRILEARMKTDLARTATTTTSRLGQISSVVSTLLDPSVLKPLTIINIFNILQLISGTFVIVFYAVNLVEDIGGNRINNYLAAVITAITRVLFSSIASVLLLKINRRYLGMFSAVGTAFASLVLAGYLLIQEESSIDVYVVGILLLAYVAVSSMGLMTFPGLMVAELLPQRARGIGGGCNFFFFNLFIFIVTKSFPAVRDAVGITGIFAIFGISALLEAIFVYVALPETKNRTLQEIEDYFQQDNLLWITRSR
ncbi:facilitated trehalose transporter Tret1-2 homolog isoform X1 [Bombus vosnesenskii]|uniref:Facilitated trehalose transporter Tret1-2 homolog isoform X1 n=3 Tax=Bombus vosnesenskii TaxID=207650 RepID=A0A6J3KB06_9HYME|nr:facilitated trehalose transporter Tret1-2 homolog isoform X1 [Bombus vosnesenskii]